MSYNRIERGTIGGVTGVVLLVLASNAVRAGAVSEEGLLPEVTVTAELRAAPALEVPASVTVLNQQTLADAGRANLEDVLGLIPNLNWAGDTSLPRYFQLRGIGELEQYQGAPNPSIGFLIDDVDFSGLGTVGTLYDLDQVEVLRGPQATRYGANALAGLIYLRSAEPTDMLYGRADLGAGDYRTRSVGGVISGPIDSLESGFRLAVQHYYSDGYYHNLYFNRHDPDRQSEDTYRGRWVFTPSDRLRAELTVFHIAINNGYDAFTIDNSRNTESDQPGVDSQHSTGVSLRVHYLTSDTVGLTAIGTYAKSLVKYSFDGDWGNPVFWAPVAAAYQYADVQNRDRSTKTVELRLGSESSQGFGWLVGLYGNQLDETLVDTSLGDYQALGAPPDPGDLSNNVINSTYRARNFAVYGELDGDLSTKLRWSVGLRGERWEADYKGTTTDYIGGGVTPAALRPSNDLWGGHASLIYNVDPGVSVYATVSRGYKAGGFNLSQGLLPSQLSFGPETDLNYETGYKADLLGHRLLVNADVFYLQRQGAQLKTSYQSDPTNPDDFVFYTGNAASGRNYGMESDVAWRATERLTLSADLGLLQTHFENFVRQGVAGTMASIVSHELANAPHWQAAVSATYRDPRGPFAHVEATGMGAYFFESPPHEETSKPYGLVNAKLGWETPRWSVYLSGRNLLNKRYPVRGFSFGDVPPDFPTQTYIQLGEPRTWFANITVNFGEDHH